jgi:hypothetical protein
MHHSTIEIQVQQQQQLQYIVHCIRHPAAAAAAAAAASGPPVQQLCVAEAWLQLGPVLRPAHVTKGPAIAVVADPGAEGHHVRVSLQGQHQPAGRWGWQAQTSAEPVSTLCQNAQDGEAMTLVTAAGKTEKGASRQWI